MRERHTRSTNKMSDVIGIAINNVWSITIESN